MPSISCLFAIPYPHLMCGLVSPGRDTSSSRTHFQRDLRSHSVIHYYLFFEGIHELPLVGVFVSFFVGKKKKYKIQSKLYSLYPELKVKFADLEERYSLLGAKINRFIKYVEQNG